MENSQVVVATFSQPIDARVLQSTLESMGIETYLDGEFMVANDPLLSNAIGGVKLKIHRDQLELAAPVVEKYQREAREARERYLRTCPKCECEDGVPVERPVWFSVVAILTLGAFILFAPWDRTRCPDCGHRWA